MLRHGHIVCKNLSRLLGLAFFTGLASQVASEPVISHVSLSDSARFEQGTKVVILGSGFGSKEIAAPILIDYVDTAFEYGVENKVNSSLGDLSVIPSGRNGFADAVWASGTSGFFYTSEGPHRHPYVNASYYFEGENEWIGKPVAYGGPEGWDTPTDNSQLYVSWWYKNKYHSTWYWRFSPNEQKGSFVVGEDLFIEGQTGQKSRGVYVGVDEDGLHNAVLYDHRNANRLVNVKINGVESGAVTTFPDDSRGGSGYGYEIVGSKLARIWDDPKGKNGIRSSVALHDAYVASAKVYYSLDLKADEWVHLEYEIDTDKGLLRIRENGKVIGKDYFSPDSIYEGKYSPTLALLGTNAKQLKLQKSWISEVYVDSSLQRIAVADASSYADITHHEIQKPSKWRDTEIEFSVNLGALSFDQGLYVYVFDEDGVVNTKGFPLCLDDSCPVPPSKIQLSID